MPEARDRLSRPDDGLTEMYIRRQRSFGSIGILADSEPEEGSIIRTPFRWGATALTNTQMGVANNTHRGIGSGVVRVGSPRRLYRSPRSLGRHQNTPSVGSGRRGDRTNSVLPSWYPRTPLNDITSVVRAIERRRARLRESEGQQLESPLPQLDLIVHNPSVLPSGAQLEHEFSLVSPSPTLVTKRVPPSVGKVPKILLDITNQKNAEESDFLTPQKKLLRSIDMVEKVVMEELRKLKRTPTAKKAEREKRVRTLMLMR